MIKPTPTPNFTQDVDRINPEKALMKDTFKVLFEFCIEIASLIAFIIFIINIFGD